jgi:hypothetical protein
MTGSHEVRGSIPLGSTNKHNNLLYEFPDNQFFFVCLWCATLQKHGIYGSLLATMRLRIYSETPIFKQALDLGSE